MFDFQKDFNGNCLVTTENGNAAEAREILKNWTQTAFNWTSETALINNSKALLLFEGFEEKSSRLTDHARKLQNSSSLSDDELEGLRLKKTLKPPTESDVAAFEKRTRKNPPDY